jgi:hypothetical protein
MTGICLIAFFGILARRGEVGRLSSIAIVTAIVLVSSFLWAVSVGGETIRKRFSSLLEGSAGEVYYRNRGHFLTYTVNELLPEYPLGAGLGRWGMMNRYFGDNSDPARGYIYVEVQWTGWLLDGGVPLVVAYSIAVFLACWIAWKVAVSRVPGNLGSWGALIFAYNIGGLAVTFGYPLFIGQGGIEFWLLNAALFAAACTAARQRPRPVRGGRA